MTLFAEAGRAHAHIGARSSMIAILDYNCGNLGSIRNMLKRAGQKAVISSEVDEVREADKLILAGVGSFDFGMEHLRSSGLLDALNQMVLVERKPVLGICLGMQLFSKRSEEGQSAGLGWINAETVRFNSAKLEAQKLKVPHMGWSDVTVAKESRIFANAEKAPRFYFVHSYHVECEQREDVLAEARHGYPFTAAIERGNIVGVQFHPEKSHRFGLALLRSFAERF
jgi:imidazole glycerol-phosphate synthase subunit HisH